VTLPREKEVLGRDLTTDEARHVTEKSRCTAAILFLAPALHANH
jgi:hypothetical protein